MELVAADPLAVDLFALAPEIALVATALLVLLTDLFLPVRRKRGLAVVAGLGTLVAAGLLIALAADVWGNAPRAAFGSAFVVDEYALVVKGLLLATAIFVIALSARYIAELRTFPGEWWFLLLAALIGMVLVPSARELVMLVVALELSTLPSFVLVGLRKFDLRSNEGALKLFVFGVISAAVLLFGVALVYGAAGTTELAGIAEALGAADGGPLGLVGGLFLLAGLGFKISAVPFHFWAPDAYEGAPLPVAAFLSVASKAAGFAALLQVTFVALLPLADVWAPVLGGVALLTMTLGNLVALQQGNLVRLLAWSSIAHAGYMLVPFGVASATDTAVNEQAFAAVLVYLFAYAVMNTGAFASVVAIARAYPERRIDDARGLGRRSPGLGVAFSVFLLSLGGVPPLVGLLAKLYIFFAALEAGTAFGVVLAAAVVLNTVVGMVYYLAVVRAMWMEEADEPAEVAAEGPTPAADAAGAPAGAARGAGAGGAGTVAPARPLVRPGPALGFAIGGLAVLTVLLFVVPGLISGAASTAAFGGV